VVRGDDIDTDRIIPARFALASTFDDLGSNVFADDRAELAAAGRRHPVDDPERRDAKVMVVGANFGCGSSREHAVQAIARWQSGIEALIGESFSVIFAANCVANGLPATQAERGALEHLRTQLEAHPAAQVSVDLDNMTITTELEDGVVLKPLPIGMAAAHRQALRSGRWDSLAELLEHFDGARALLSGLPYPTLRPAGVEVAGCQPTQHERSSPRGH
jgi:3-isopropylmalate/(R)-2-methylmalate dehydratase small subunit